MCYQFSRCECYSIFFLHSNCYCKSRLRFLWSGLQPACEFSLLGIFNSNSSCFFIIRILIPIVVLSLTIFSERPNINKVLADIFSYDITDNRIFKTLKIFAARYFLWHYTSNINMSLLLGVKEVDENMEIGATVALKVSGDWGREELEGGFRE